MKQEVQQAYSAVVLENKERMLENIFSAVDSGQWTVDSEQTVKSGSVGGRRQQPRWKIIAANVAAAACLVIVAVALLLTRGQTSPNILTSVDKWLYYPAGEFGLFRVNEDGSKMEKVDNAFDIAEGTQKRNVKEAKALGNWIYYSMTYRQEEDVSECAALYRLRADGAGKPERLVKTQ